MKGWEGFTWPLGAVLQEGPQPAGRTFDPPSKLEEQTQAT